MHLFELSDATSFLTRSSSHLLEFEAQNNLILSSSLTLARASATRSPKLSFFVVEEKSKTICAALNSSERRLLLSVSEPEAAAFMGHELATRDVRFKGVLGPRVAAASFCRAYTETSGRNCQALEEHAPQNVLRLAGRDAVSSTRSQATGLTRVASRKDMRLLLKWTRAFVEESGIEESQRESEEILHRYLENRQLFIWEDQQPVAMAGFSGITPNGVRVNMVYTDPAHRSRGYAGSLVNVLSQRLLADGHRSCFLYVESANVAANRVYQRLGYEAVGHFTEYKFRAS